MAPRSTAMSAAFGGALLFLACTHTVDGTGPENASSSGTTSGGSSSSGGSDEATDAFDVENLCSRIVACDIPDITYDVCVATLHVARGTSSCVQQAAAVSCATFPEFRRSCFPDCTQVRNPNECHSEDGTIRICGADGWLYRVSCDAYCQANGLSWSGVCGREDPSSGKVEARDICWCQQS